MLKEQLKITALKFFTVPARYELCIDDFEGEKAMFMWKDINSDEDYYVELDKNGKLLYLSQPSITTNVRISVEEQLLIAEQFLTSQYAEALDYFTLSKVMENEDYTRFKFEQLVGGYPLATYYCFIEISHNGQVLNFNFRGYTKNLPSLPETLAPKESILAKLYEADWIASMSYLSSESYSVPASGLYVLYESPVVYSTFDAVIGTNSFEREQEDGDDMESEIFVPMPTVVPHIPEKTIEAIIGVTPISIGIPSEKCEFTTLINEQRMQDFIQDLSQYSFF
ncbi:YcdB/YcdC domain-containing protein [Lysinibacillus sp. NPDC096418]|uniref:YcdB/YcdC domain-containing protein n=1 Tax=Lysinibacillus sp. NPDC096418 TaxID=3364138 RepID=UPI00382A3E49